MDTDIAVIGSGIAGLFFSLKIPRKYRVTVFTKKGKEDTITNYAQGGIASVFGKDDSFELHIKDTLNLGDGLSNRKRVELMVKEAPRLVNELHSLGVGFTLDENGGYALGREAAHSRKRIIHAKDRTGQTIEDALISGVIERKSVEIIEDRIAVDLTIKDGRCTGLWVIDQKERKIESVSARVTLIATGGIGQVYLHTTNPSVSSGDGIGMAARCGMKIANMEFIQFHPTSLWTEEIQERSFLISEAVRGEGGILVLKNGEPFMEKYHPSGSLAPRDVVARAIARELKKTGDEYVYLDLSKIPSQKIKDRFPGIYEGCLSYGIEITKEPIPCVPSAHYLCGGILVDENGFTGIEGLYAAGETACTGVHGANRLASNSLLESLAFSERAALHAISNISRGRCKIEDYVRGKNSISREYVEAIRDRLKNIMWERLGITRRVKGMELAKEEISSLLERVSSLWKDAKPDAELLTLQNMLCVSKLIALSALKRKESRGLHWVEEYPKKDERYRRDTIISSQM